MAIRHKNVEVRRDELTKLRCTVAEWEVPLLFLVHGQEMVTVLDGEPWADVDPPDVQDEYRRLEAKYRTPPKDNGEPGERAVSLVYGAFGSSPSLRHAIEAATFERPADLLGLQELESASVAADAVAAKAKARLEAAQAASEDSGQESETPAAPARKPRAQKAAASLL